MLDRTLPLIPSEPFYLYNEKEARIETPEDLALINARLARILRFTDWDSEKREPILWTPPQEVKA